MILIVAYHVSLTNCKGFFHITESVLTLLHRHNSALTSAKKPFLSVAQRTHVENIRKAMGMRSVKEYFCSALINTYGAVRIA